MSILYCDKCDCALHACTCGDTHYADDATLKHIQELTAQLEASRKEVVRLLEALNTAKSRFYNLAIHNDEMQCGVIPSVGVSEIEAVLASTTPDPVWEHNWHVEWMRKLPVVVVGCPDMAKDGRCAPVAWLNNYPKDGEKLVAIPELKEVKE